MLDADYVSKELAGVFRVSTDKTIIGRMSAQRFLYKELHWEVKELIGKGKYSFVRKHHAYFGKRKKITLFVRKSMFYIYVDQYNALKRYSDYLTRHEEEYQLLKDKDKDWLTVKYGYFILVFNIKTTLAQLLLEYFVWFDTVTYVFPKW